MRESHYQGRELGRDSERNAMFSGIFDSAERGTRVATYSFFDGFMVLFLLLFNTWRYVSGSLSYLRDANMLFR